MGSFRLASFCQPCLSTMVIISSSTSECVESLLACSCSPIFIRIPQRIYRNVAVLDVFDPREDLLDVVPIDDGLTVDMVARNFFDICPPFQAKGLSNLHCWLWTMASILNEREG